MEVEKFELEVEEAVELFQRDGLVVRVGESRRDGEVVGFGPVGLLLLAEQAAFVEQTP